MLAVAADRAARRRPSCCRAVTPSSKPISSAILPFFDAKHGRSGEPHLPARSRREGTDEKVTESGPRVRATAFPTTDHVVALCDEVRRTPEVEIRECLAEPHHELL